MGGVDVADQLRSTYNTQRRTGRWWVNLYYWLLDVTIVNAYCCYNELRERQDRMTHLAFRQAIVTEILRSAAGAAPAVEPAGDRRVRARKDGYAVPIQVLASGRHWPGKTDERKLCRQCWKHESTRGTKTYFECVSCREWGYPGIHLCPDNCFRIYHTSCASV